MDFIKYISFIQNNKIDSLKAAFLPEYNDNSAYFSYCITEAIWILQHSNSTPKIDSVRVTDSIFIQEEKLFAYYYSVPFYYDSNYVGKIEVEFIKSVQVNFIARAEPLIDTNGFSKLESVLKNHGE